MSIIKDMPYEWWVGLRYTRAGKRSGRNRFISFISWISVAGIALGVAALIVVLSVMNGFQKEVTDRMLSVVAHIEVFDARGVLPDWRRSASEALRNPGVRAAAPFVDMQGMLVVDGTMKPALVRGVLQLDLGSGVIIGQTPPCYIFAVVNSRWHLCGQTECTAVAVDVMLRTCFRT